MRRELIRGLLVALLGASFAACGSLSASSVGGPTGGAADQPAGNFDDQGGGGAAAQPTKATTPPDNKGGLDLSPADIPGCVVPDAGAAPNSIFMTVPNANWFASATQARGMLNKHLAPDPTSVRAADFLAYYAVSYGPLGGQNGSALDVVELTGPGQSDYHLAVQIGVLAPALAAESRPPTSLTFVLDTSTSMAGRSIELAIEAMQAATKSLVVGDSVNVVTTLSSSAPRKLTVAAKNDPKLLQALGGAQADGGDDIPGAIARAYGVALATYKPGGLNRVVFISDGGAPPTLIDAALIKSHADAGAQGDIRLVGVGVGDPEGYQPALLERAAGAGRGAVLFVDSKAEADATLGGARFDAVMGVAASQVKLELTFPWYFTPDDQAQSGVFSGEASQIVPTELGPGGVLTFRQLLRACNPIAIDPADTITASVTWQPLAGGPQVSSVSLTIAQTKLNPAALAKAKAVLDYADALRSLQPSRLKAAQHEIAILSATQPGDPDLAEIASLLAMHPLY